MYTRVDPCIKCTRSKLDTGQGVLGLVVPEDLLSVCCLVLPLVLSSVVLSPLVSSCLGFSALVSSCVVCWASPGPFLGLSRASLGTNFGPPEGGRPLASWASFGALLAAESEFSRNPVKPTVFAWLLHGFGPSGGLLAPPGPLLAALGWLLSWVALGPS